MRSRTLVLLMWLILPVAAGYAGELREIEMTDGSIITAEVISLSGGSYTINSAALGTIQVPEPKVRAIRIRPSDRNPAASSSADTRSLQDKMLNDKEIMTMILSLQNDLEFKKILEDPQMMKAVNDGDVAALSANPRFMKLLNNSVVQDIQKKVK